MNRDSTLGPSVAPIEPVLETPVILKIQTSITRSPTEEYILALFTPLDFFCFYRLEKGLGTPLVVVHFAQIHHISSSIDRGKFKLMIKNRGIYSFKLKLPKLAVQFERVASEKMKVFQISGSAITRINEDQMRDIIMKYIRTKMAKIDFNTDTQTNLSAFIGNKTNLRFDIKTEYLDGGPIEQEESEISFVLDSDRDIITKESTNKQLMFDLPTGSRFSEIETLIERVQYDEMLNMHLWAGVIYNYKLSNITGAFFHDSNIKNYAQPIFVIIFTSKPSIKDFSVLSKASLNKLFHNDYWQDCLPAWLEPNIAYVFPMDSSLPHPKTSEAYPYVNIIPL
jgi:hypothetical protein